MKKQIMTIAFAAMFVVGGATLIGCGNDHSHDGEDHEHHDGDHEHAYQCPMDCENGKTYAEEGKCPKCDMDLEEVHEE